jgi:hypothetical protein
VTAPGGAPGLPTGTVLRLENLESRLQDLTSTAMKGRALDWFPALTGSTTGGSPASALSPFGFLTDLWARFNSTIANADPSAVNSVEDLGPLFEEFVLNLPFVGQFLGILEALLGVYHGEDQNLLNVQALFAPVRQLIGLIPGINALLALVGINPGTGSAAPGSNPLDAIWGGINQGLSDLAGLFQQIFGQQATGQAQINNLGSGGFTHDFSINGVAGWTALVGAFVLSVRGQFVQAATETVAYRASGIAADKFGMHFIAAPSMRGVMRGGICALSDGTMGVDLEVYRGFDGDALRLVTRGSPKLTVVRQQADFIGANRLGDVTALDLRCDGADKFTVLRNLQPVRWNDNTFEWSDGGAITHNSTTRGVLLTSNGDDRHDDGFWGPAIQGKTITYGTW